jgi:hypothetical protein
MKKIYITLLAIAAIGASQVVLTGEQEDNGNDTTTSEEEKPYNCNTMRQHYSDCVNRSKEQVCDKLIIKYEKNCPH